jgi:protein SCO1/2
VTPPVFSRRALLVVAAAAALMAAGCNRQDAAAPQAAAPVAFNGIDITGAEYARTLALPDADGAPRTLAEFKGKAVVIFFGYTQCPDVCPTSMAELAQAKKALGADGARVQGLFVTVDPVRDTPQVLKDYLAAFDPSFVGLRGDAEQTKAAAKEFKVFFAKVDGKTATSYTMDHTAGLYVIDPAGKVRLFVRNGGGPDALASDLKAILAQFPPA